ncbi:MAG: hypothetical protein ACREVN_08380 [Gammaproteobacteria bacterium]
MKSLAPLCTAILGLSLSLHPVTGNAGENPVRLSVNIPLHGGKGSIQNSSGWPITVRLLARRNLGIANGEPEAAAPAGTFPKTGQTGWIVFDDPDGCLTLFPPFDPPPHFDGSCDGAVTDEVFLMFTPDMDMAGVQDDIGDPDRRAALTESGGGGNSKFLGGPDGMSLVALGPDTGADIVDGYGRGADDDLPGLVVLSSTGPGLVLDENFDRGPVIEQYNLAGYLNQVGYELTDATAHTSVVASLFVPYGLIAAFAQVDTCVGVITDPVLGLCDMNSLWRIDGGPVEPIEPPGSGAEAIQTAYPALFDGQRWELSFFAVSGIAPSILTDMNGNHRITARDAELMGFNVISNEVRIRFRQFHGLPCFRSPFSQVLLSDLDGNGDTVISIACSPGPGGLTKPPR